MSFEHSSWSGCSGFHSRAPWFRLGIIYALAPVLGDIYLDIFTSAGLAPNDDPYLTGYFINVVCQRPFSNANDMSCFERLSPRLEKERTPLNARLPATRKECLGSYLPPIIDKQKRERINRYHRLLDLILQNMYQTLLRECHSN